jgi:hypothetical protein
LTPFISAELKSFHRNVFFFQTFFGGKKKPVNPTERAAKKFKREFVFVFLSRQTGEEYVEIKSG